MRPLPDSFIQSLEGIPGFDKTSFLRVHEGPGQVTSIRVNPAKTGKEFTARDVASLLRLEPENISQIPWAHSGYYLSHRPSFTFDPLFHAGCYYVQEASSMFLEQAMQQCNDLSASLKVLDLCAAPGGKSTHLQSILSNESLLVSNEVIRGRSNVLSDNILKWGSSNVLVTNNDPVHFQRFPGFFDVMVVDAPCSGSGLFRKDPGAIDEWSLNNVALCSQRQQRILADALTALKEGGVLIYATCSYSALEDEAIAGWLVEEMKLQPVRLKMDPAWGIVETGTDHPTYGYRFFPDKVKGEGFFMACFRKMKDEPAGRNRPVKMEKASSKEKAILQDWTVNSNMELLKDDGTFWMVPSNLSEDLAALSSGLKVLYKGTRMGSIMKDRLVPDHALALSPLVSVTVPVHDLSYEDAVLYLQRREISLAPSRTGWQLVRYQSHNLGWINALSNRINNYYPKELRILKQQNDALSGK